MNKYSNNNYNKNLKQLARKLRKNPTKAETVMWREVLGEKQMMEYRFLRQRPIGNYIVDFFCKELKLIIEVDGYTHQFEEVAAKDQTREKELKEMGYFVLRFEDSEVLSDINNVVRTIENWILDQKVTP
ncbi:Very-short-patch-repair endonuclease [Ekhidna lutea]|uniref:Very-short-patch-repair endonuclease n=1 Tax=Ekhidna lutea TaxID=447679 RepID=A0A239EFR7_EKHLU|nr:endonuclease domain-containing protein [Ekhidna lutea]SNS43271.1 Very-short-patch-repair endonuclease [Ekhidna lutea]